MEKIYTAFISSAFKSLRDERKMVIDVLLDHRILPLGMEHFTISTNGNFSDIQELIDESDIFILLLGKSYGSCDEKGISWTEREYKYAITKNKPMVVIKCDELVENLKKDKDSLSEDERKQIEFSKGISVARAISEEFTIERIINQFLNGHNFAESIGWTRIENIKKDKKKLAIWRENNQVYNIAGIWYHVHLSELDESYIRIGTWKIEQDFSPNEYHKFSIKGKNYNVDYYDLERKVLYENEMKVTKIVGEYSLQNNGEIFGIFNAERKFNGDFNKQQIEKKNNKGIHEFEIDVEPLNHSTEKIKGYFYDVAPSPKYGVLYMFRDAEQRNRFLLKNRKKYIEVR